MKIYISQWIPECASKILSDAGFEVYQSQSEQPIPREELLERCKNADGILSLLTDSYDKELIDSLNNCKVIANCAVGYNNIDISYAATKNIVVTNTPDVLTDATAEIAMSLIIACARRVVEGDKLLREGRFTGWRPDFHLGLELKGKTLGIVGAGRIGRATAKRAKAFGMDIIYFNRTRKEEFERDTGAVQVSLDVLLSGADVVSLHLPLSDDTYQLLDKENLSKLKSSAILVNTARGELVDEEHLIKMLQDHKIFAAGLDVYMNEPDVNKDFYPLDNVILLPHIGSATLETRNSMASLAARNIVEVLNNRKALTPVNIL